jgi:hypothetical protein
MYRPLLGDCFLLSLPSDRGRPFHLMIDCGVILGTPSPEVKMAAVVEDVIAATGGHVDLVVATHEHWDHLSGFLQAADLFTPGDEGDQNGRLRIDDLWLAWTEDSKDDLANLLRAQRKKTERGLRLALTGLRAAEAREAGLRAAEAGDGRGRVWTASKQVESLLGFFGAAGGTTGDALAALRSYAQNPPRYCRPGEPPIELPGVPGVRIYVLGPPYDEKLIKRSHPSEAHPEVYEAAFGLTPDAAFFAAAIEENEAAEGGFAGLREASQPFDRTLGVGEADARRWPFFEQRYWGEAEGEDDRDQSWRRIDAEWLGSAAELALKLDEDTNNTSLVLAIELTASGRVLLFPGDAQVGNWLSWEGLSWTFGDGRRVSAHDLLARTVLYKVGHHGSHNATLRDKGLELMNHRELVALIPVDHEMAKKKGWSKIPFEPLMTRLAEKTSGRVLRGDSAQPIHDLPPPDGVPAAVWRRFQSSVEDTALYFEIRIPL